MPDYTPRVKRTEWKPQQLVPAPSTFPTAQAQGGGSMAALPLIAGAAQGVSSAIGAINQGKANKAQLDEQRRQFNAGQQLDRGQLAVGAQGQLDAMPLKDRIMFNLMQRMGTPSQSFQARDMFNPQNGPAQAGGIDQNALNQKLGSYTPGAGGQTPDVLQKFLAVLGYGQGSTPQATTSPFGAPGNMALTPSNAQPAANPFGQGGPPGAQPTPQQPQKPDFFDIIRRLMPQGGR